MKHLPIYPGSVPPLAAVEGVLPLDRSQLADAAAGPRGKMCDLCALGARPKLRHPCVGAEGEAGGLLVIGEAPSHDDDVLGRPFTGAGGTNLRKLIKMHWDGPVAFDMALRCFPGRGAKLTDKMFNACRGYLRQTIEEVRPTRILLVGSAASVGLFGRTAPSLTMRGAYGFLRTEYTDANGIDHHVPVFFVNTPFAAARNRFIRKWFEEDVMNALTCADPAPGPWDARAQLIETAEDALAAERDLRTQDWIAYDVETCGEMWTESFDVISVAVCGDADEDPWVWTREALRDPTIRAPLLRLLKDKKLPKVGQNVKYDQLAIRARYGVRVRPILRDTRLMRKLAEPEADGALDRMAELVGMGGLKEDAQEEMSAIVHKVKLALRKKTPEAQDAALRPLHLPPHIETAIRLGDPVERYMYALLKDDSLHRYNARDSIATTRLAHALAPAVENDERLHRIWKSHVRPAAEALERVEGWGVAASRDAIAAFDHYLMTREQQLQATLSGFGDVNWDSRDQVAEMLFTTLRLPVVKMTPTGKPSTDADVLEMLRGKHPLPGALLDYRFVTKLRGTYATGMYGHVKSDDRIHPNVKLDGARSGRTSCTDPNLQNIPRPDSPEGKMARDCFVAPPGKLLVELDYSQLELRVACMLSQDPVMLEIFKSGIDYHLRTAQLVSQVAWGITPEQVEKKHRSMAKNVNFGVLYGKTAKSLAKEWGISVQKAQAIVDAIMGNFKQLQAWCAARLQEAQRTGLVWTYWNGEPARRRPLYRVADADDAAASVARNGAVNSPIQGTASDFCIASLAESVQWIEDEGLEDDVKLVLPIHDALLFEVSEHMVDEVVGTVREIMTGHDSQGVPLIADCKVGKAWGSMEDRHAA